MLAAIRLCAAPFVDAACNHNSGCIVDCLTEACFGCYSEPDACEASAQAGTCATYFAADACVAQALAGPAAFCNPDTYHGNYGLWLQAVATSYCGE